MLFCSQGWDVRIEIQYTSSLDRAYFLALYLYQRASFLVSLDTDTYAKDTIFGSLDTEPVSWLGTAEP